MKKKTPTQLAQWKYEAAVAEFVKLRNEVERLKKLCAEHVISIYSSDQGVCIGMSNQRWHQIVCGPMHDRNWPHWKSSWTVDEKGFHLEAMHDENACGWFGQYREDNKLKFDELPRDVLDLHHKTLVEHIKTLNIWYPCAIYNDFTGELFRP